VFNQHRPSRSSSEKHGTGPGPVNLYVAVRAITVLGVEVVLRARRFNCADVMSQAMTRQTELRHAAGY